MDIHIHIPLWALIVAGIVMVPLIGRWLLIRLAMALWVP